jgi:hypothetical protein
MSFYLFFASRVLVVSSEGTRSSGEMWMERKKEIL